MNERHHMAEQGRALLILQARGDAAHLLVVKSLGVGRGGPRTGRASARKPNRASSICRQRAKRSQPLEAKISRTPRRSIAKSVAGAIRAKCSASAGPPPSSWVRNACQSAGCTGQASHSPAAFSSGLLRDLGIPTACNS